MRTRLTERDLSRIVRRVINEQDLEKDEVILNPIKPILQNTIEKIKDRLDRFDIYHE